MTNIELKRGDTIPVTLSLTDTLDPENPVPLDLTGKRVAVTCREKIDGTVVYEHYLVVNDAGSVTDSQGMSLVGEATEGAIAEVFSSDETALFKLTKSGRTFPWDLEVRTIGAGDDPDVVTTTLSGTHTVVGDVTLPPE